MHVTQCLLLDSSSFHCRRLLFFRVCFFFFLFSFFILFFFGQRVCLFAVDLSRAMSFSILRQRKEKSFRNKSKCQNIKKLQRLETSSTPYSAYAGSNLVPVLPGVYQNLTVPLSRTYRLSTLMIHGFFTIIVKFKCTSSF